tara:strand:+ start:137 stop:400 length:264 start_codon:yes stop_codon:yes gene_type:complete
MGFVIARLIGGIIYIYIFSFIFRFTVFRKFNSPKQQIYSILLIYPIVAIIAVVGGESNFVNSFFVYGIASALLIAFLLTINLIRKSK